MRAPFGALRFLPNPIEADDLLAAVADALTGQAASQGPLSVREFYAGYRERLESELKQKAAQIARNRQQLAALPETQRETYRRLIAEAQEQYAEIQRAGDALLNIVEKEE